MKVLISYPFHIHTKTKSGKSVSNYKNASCFLLLICILMLTYWIFYFHFAGVWQLKSTSSFWIWNHTFLDSVKDHSVMSEGEMMVNRNCTNNRYYGYTGLDNMGNSCYLSAVLQCLANCPQLSHYIMSRPKHKQFSQFTFYFLNYFFALPQVVNSQMKYVKTIP